MSLRLEKFRNIPKLAWRLVFWSSWRAGHLDNLCFWMFGLISSTGLLDIVQSINDADLQQLKSKVVKTHHVWQYFAVTNYGIVWSLWCLWKDGRSQNPEKGCCDSIFLSWKLHFFQRCKLVSLWHMIEESMEFAKWKVTKLLLNKRRNSLSRSLRGIEWPFLYVWQYTWSWQCSSTTRLELCLLDKGLNSSQGNSHCVCQRENAIRGMMWNITCIWSPGTQSLQWW